LRIGQERIELRVLTAAAVVAARVGGGEADRRGQGDLIEQLRDVAGRGPRRDVAAVQAEARRVPELVGALDAVRPSLRVARDTQRAGEELAREPGDLKARSVELRAGRARDLEEAEGLDREQGSDAPLRGEAVELDAGGR